MTIPLQVRLARACAQGLEHMCTVQGTCLQCKQEVVVLPRDAYESGVQTGILIERARIIERLRELGQNSYDVACHVLARELEDFER